MKIDIRPARPEEMDEYRHVATTSLVISPDKMPPETIHMIIPELTCCAFMDDKLVTSYAAWPLTMRFNGSSIPVAGITFVGTHPIYRRHGLLRKVITKHFELLHHQGQQPLALLYASQAAIYQRYGYGIVSTRTSYTVEPRYLTFAQSTIRSHVKGKLRELKDNEVDILKAVYKLFCSDRIGYIHRARTMWESSVFLKPMNGGVLCKMVYEEEGKPLGYLVYTVEPQNVEFGQPWQRLFIRDLAWLTPSAYVAIWDFLSTMHLVTDINWIRVPSDDPLPHLLQEPRKLNIRSADGMLARIIDIAPTLEQRHYCEKGDVVFEILDDLCPWNNGCWELNISAGSATISKTNKKPELTIPIDTFVMIIFGQITATQAARMGRLEVHTNEAVAVYDHVFRTTYRPFCADFF